MSTRTSSSTDLTSPNLERLISIRESPSRPNPHARSIQSRYLGCPLLLWLLSVPHLLQSSVQNSRRAHSGHPGIPSAYKRQLGIQDTLYSSRQRSRTAREVAGPCIIAGNHIQPIATRNARSERSRRAFWGGDYADSSKASHTEQAAPQALALHRLPRD